MFPNKRGQKSKLQKSLTKQQQAELSKWLFVEEITYREAIHRLKERFGVVACLANLNGFYHSHCPPDTETGSQSNNVLLDVILKRRAKGGLQITILQASPKLALHGHRNLKALIRRERGA